MKTLTYKVKEEVIEKLLDLNSAFDLYEQKEIIDEVIDITEQVLRLHGVIRTERGWAGHFICANRCRFRRNTLLAYNEIKIVVSSLGLMEIDGKFDTVGAGRHFETMAFHADKNDKRYFDADVSKQVYFDNDWAIAEVDADDKANEMHEAVVAEISTKLEQGYKFEVTE